MLKLPHWLNDRFNECFFISCNGSTKQFGPCLKIILCICITVVLIAWLPVGITCGVLAGAVYGLLAPMFATFQAVEEGKADKFYHCICVCESCQIWTYFMPPICIDIYLQNLFHRACRMEFWALSKEASLSLGIFWMFLTIHTWRLWLIYGFKRESIMRLGLLFS